MPIRYKVVKKKSRISAVVNGNSIYALKYIKDTEVFAKPETLGVMTFTTRTAAEDFAWSFEGIWSDTVKMIVIRVQSIGKGSAPHYISREVRSYGLECFYSGEEYFWSESSPPDNTMCYPGVKVLE